MSELLKINVNDHVEKKQNLSYLSWAWAWAEVLKIDPQATWEAVEFNGFPASFAPDGSALVKVLVSIKGHTKSCWLPVMNHSNKAIKNPDAFAINTALVRCLTKCISMHGLGLYIYAGEDLPEDEQAVGDRGKEPTKFAHQKGNERAPNAAHRVADEIIEAIREDLTLRVVEKYQAACEDSAAFADQVWARLSNSDRKYITDALNAAGAPA